VRSTDQRPTACRRPAVDTVPERQPAGEDFEDCRVVAVVVEVQMSFSRATASSSVGSFQTRTGLFSIRTLGWYPADKSRLYPTTSLDCRATGHEASGSTRRSRRRGQATVAPDSRSAWRMPPSSARSRASLESCRSHGWRWRRREAELGREPGRTHHVQVADVLRRGPLDQHLAHALEWLDGGDAAYYPGDGQGPAADPRTDIEHRHLGVSRPRT